MTDTTLPDQKTHLREPFDAYFFLETVKDFIKEKIILVVKEIFEVNKKTDQIIVTSENQKGNLTIVSQTQYSNATSEQRKEKRAKYLNMT